MVALEPTVGADTKVGLSDPVVLSGNAIAQRIKATLGITGLSLPRVHIDGVVWHLEKDRGHVGFGRVRLFRRCGFRSMSRRACTTIGVVQLISV